MEKNQEFLLEITDMTEEGAGVGKQFDACSCVSFPWFVKDAVIGDRIRAAATKVKKNYGFARLVQVLEPSADRVQPECPIARACGGCQLQQISYRAQLAFKENRVRSALTRIGGFSEIPEFEPIIGMNTPWRYRNKAQYPVSRDKNGRIIAGFYAEHTHSVIRCEDCRIGAKTDRTVLEKVLEWMEKCRISPYDETSGKGILRHVLIRTSRTTGEIMVCLVINAETLPAQKELLALLLPDRRETERKGGYIATVSYSVNTKDTNVILGEKIVTVFGDGYITDSIGGLSFHISPQSFFQVNPEQVEKLYGKALEYAQLSGKETVWDLYCGVGTISLFLSKKAEKVYGVEIVPKAIEDARDNARRNGIDNAEFFVGSAEEVVPAWMEAESDETRKHPDVICVDPPRKGCDEICLKTILEAAPERIVYVSCDPATLARDLKFLCANGYALEKVCPVDMFPQTVHVETIVLLQRENS